MKTQIINYLLFFSIVLSNKLISQDRNVMWVHGMGGTANSWQTNSRTHAAIYKMNCKNAEYAKGEDANAAAKNVKKQFSKYFPGQENNLKNIVISHSFGGLTTRKLEKNNSDNGVAQNFGGQILVHSPQIGAVFASNFLHGVFDNQLEKIWNSISEPFKNDPLIGTGEIKIAQKGIIGLEAFSKDVNMNDMYKLFSTILGKLPSADGAEALDFLYDKIEMSDFYDPPKLKDLLPNSDLVQELNHYVGPSKLITIWGAEEHNIFKRLMSTLLVKPGNKTLDIVSDDSKLLDVIANLYELNGNVNRTLGTMADVSGLNLYKKILTGENTPFHERARVWFAGADYVNTGLERDWLIAIGGIQFQIMKGSKEHLSNDCSNKLAKLEDLLEDFHRTGEFKNIQDVRDAIKDLTNNPNCYVESSEDMVIEITNPNDGVVLTESQKAAGGEMFENKNCNHFEALNTKVLSTNFKDIFQNNQRNTAFFQTSQR